MAEATKATPKAPAKPEGPAYGVTTEPVPGGFVTRLKKWPKPVNQADPGTPDPVYGATATALAPAPEAEDAD